MPEAKKLQLCIKRGERMTGVKCVSCGVMFDVHFPYHFADTDSGGIVCDECAHGQDPLLYRMVDNPRYEMAAIRDELLDDYASRDPVEFVELVAVMTGEASDGHDGLDEDGDSIAGTVKHELLDAPGGRRGGVRILMSKGTREGDFRRVMRKMAEMDLEWVGERRTSRDIPL